MPGKSDVLNIVSECKCRDLQRRELGRQGGEIGEQNKEKKHAATPIRGPMQKNVISLLLGPLSSFPLMTLKLADPEPCQ